jgi:RhoGAP domain
VDNGDSLCDAHPLDIASLLKQFLRELPEPLFTSALHDIFVSSVRDNIAIPEAILLACLLLPSCNLATLRYVALFLSKVAASSSVNRMDAANLAVCLAPNLLYAENSRTSVTDSSVLIAETAVIRFVVEHASNIGMVCNSLLQRAVLLGACFSSDMEEQNATTHIGAGTSTTGARGGGAKRKKKKRSGSLQGKVPLCCYGTAVLLMVPLFCDSSVVLLWCCCVVDGTAVLLWYCCCVDSTTALLWYCCVVESIAALL